MEARDRDDGRRTAGRRPATKDRAGDGGEATASTADRSLPDAADAEPELKGRSIIPRGRVTVTRGRNRGIKPGGSERSNGVQSPRAEKQWAGVASAASLADGGASA